MTIRRMKKTSSEPPDENGVQAPLGGTESADAGAMTSEAVRPDALANEEAAPADDYAPYDDQESDRDEATMTVSVTMPVATPLVGEMRRPWDPAEATTSKLARRVRALTGVTEPLLDRIPTERARYTALACVMLCTASVSGISMFFALSEILGSASLWFVPFALFWAFLILTLDRWLVSSPANKHSLVRVQTLLMRLMIAVVLGFIIAEPLLLRVFQTAVVNQVITDRQAATNHGIGMYKECNPLPGASVPTGVDCAAWTLSVSGADSAADEAQIDKLKTDIQGLTSALGTENATLQKFAAVVNEECNGVSGQGLTGRAGDGPACHDDQQHYEDYKNSQPFAQQNAELSNDENQLASLEKQDTGDTKDMATQLTRQINAWAAKQPSAQTPIGLIERFKALIELSKDSVVVNLGAWLLRIFFVLIDCLPVLAKFIGGLTPYDELARGDINTANNELQVEGRTRIDAAEIHRKVRLKWEQAQAAKLEQSYNADVRDHAAAIEAKQWEAIDRDYESRLSRMGLTADRKDPEPEPAPPRDADAAPDPLGAPARDFATKHIPFPHPLTANGRAVDKASG